MLILGTYSHTIDDKNRLTIPAKFRSRLVGVVCYVSKGFDQCLEVRTEAGFKTWATKLQAIGEARKSARALKRQVMANSDAIKCDSAGRIKLASHLLAIANITRDVIIIGNGDKFEIWDKIVWDQYQKENIGIEDVADEFSELI